MRFIKTSLVVCLAALWLPSCTNEEAPVSTDTGNTYTAQVRMTASREMFDGTRSSLTDNGDGKLTPAWEVGDKVYVTTVFEGSQNESYAGTLEVVSTSNNGQSAEFSGSVSGAVYNGEKAYKFYFLGNNTKFDGEIAEKKYDFSSQNGLMPTLQNDDLLIGKANIKFTDGAGTVNVPFERQFSYAHYKLVCDGQELATKGVEVSISAENLATTASVDFTTASIIPGAAAPIKVTPAESNDFYVTLVPNYEETTLTFTCQVDGVNFIGTRKLSNNKNNKFYRSNEEGHGAIPIEMNKVVTNTYNVVYHFIDDSETIDYKEIISSVYAISGQEATSYTVLDFGNVDFGSKDFARSDATTFSPENGKFSEKDIVAFLGWGKDSSNKASNDGNVDYAAGAVINLDELLNGNNGETLHLYAKSGYIEYKLVFGYNVPRDDRGEELIGGKYSECSPISRYREWGWFDVSTATTSDGKYPHDFYGKSGHEIIGWSRKQESSRQEGDEVIPLKGYVRIHKDDQVREDEPNTALNPGDKVATITVTLYPVWKKIENGTIDITNYGTGSLE